MREISAWLSVEDGQYWITDSNPDAEFVLPGPGGASGLVGVVPGLAIVITGTQFGNVAFTVQSGDSDPGPDTGGWDEVVEVSLVSGAAGQGLGILSGGQGPGELATLTPAGAGSYRIRVHARGRDAGAADDVVTGEPAEEHLLQIWPAPPAPEIIRKTTDEHGAGFRAGAETSSGPDPRSPHGRHVMLEVSQPVTATGRASAVLERIYVRSGGCEFEFRIVVDVSGMTPQQEKRARRAVDGYRGATLPESTDPGRLRVVLHFSDGRTAEFAADTDRLPRSGPSVSSHAFSNYPKGSTQVAEESFWSWPLPPAEPFTLTLDWPAVGIPSASITIDGAAIVAAAGTLPPLDS